jgi:hypothetical protein
MTDVGFFDFGPEPEDRRVLILSYYFPPSGGPGVQRILKTVRYLGEYGWQPTVVTVREGAYPKHDATLLKEVPPTVTVERTRSLEPFAWYAALTGRGENDAVAVGSVAGRGTSWAERLARWIRANVFLPDARVGWVPYAVTRGLRLLTDAMQTPEPNFDAILTTGPPHSTHLAGWVLHRLTDVPWLADFRDPWTDINYYHELPHMPLARRLDAALERLVVRSASAVVSVSPTWCGLMSRKGAKSVYLVQNGYDAADFPRFAYGPSEDAFVLTYVGSLYASRNPVTLWRTLQRLRAAGCIPKLRLRLVGTVEPVVHASLRRYGLDAIAEHVPYVPHREAIGYMQKASLLLLVVERFGQDAGMLTGKVYEYLASRRPVLGIGPPEGDASLLLDATMAGTMVDQEDAAGIAALVQGYYTAWEHGHKPTGAPMYVVREFSRQAQTAALADALYALSDPPTRDVLRFA